MRPEQLTVANIAKALRLVEETVILVSETVAIPEDGMFQDVDILDLWTVQGDKATGPRFGGSGNHNPIHHRSVLLLRVCLCHPVAGRYVLKQAGR